MVTDTNAKQPENSMETHKVYLQMFCMSSNSYFTNISTIFKLSCTPHCDMDIDCHLVKFALERTVASEVSTPLLSHIPVSRSHIE